VNCFWGRGRHWAVTKSDPPGATAAKREDASVAVSLRVPYLFQNALTPSHYDSIHSLVMFQAAYGIHYNTSISRGEVSLHIFHTQWLFWVLRRIFGPKRDEVKG
jgi:hypothetical protein